MKLGNLLLRVKLSSVELFTAFAANPVVASSGSCERETSEHLDDVSDDLPDDFSERAKS
jgi:hypothetical protein